MLPIRFVDEECMPAIPRLVEPRRRRGHEVATPEEAHARAAWRRPTADDLEFRLVRVVKGEKTCLGCGDTFIGGFCTRCGLPEPGEKNGRRRDNLPPSVATDSYLYPEEYRIVGG